jgi:2-(1,2-epoxy-1,2-dihydrophenyl)acetyl-CoA isomerase
MFETMPGTDGAVTLEMASGVAYLRLTRPEEHNGLTPEVVTGLVDAVGLCDGHPEVRAVLISAEGRNFSVGGDLNHFAKNAHRLADELQAMIGPYHAALNGLAALPVPVVCAVQGVVAGGALGLLWTADVVLAADDLQLTTAFARLGLSGDGGSSWALPHLVGIRRATQLLFNSDVLGADQALEWGLVDRVVPREALQPEAEAEAQRLAAGPTVAYAHIKRLLRTSLETSWPEQLAAERAAMVDCGRTGDAREGVLAFTEKRPPKFEGR